MKKLLGILGTITIAGSGMTGIVGNAPMRTKENNLEVLKRIKRDNQNLLEVWYEFLAHDTLKAKISHNTWLQITNLSYQSKTEFKNSLFLLLNIFPKLNKSKAGEWDEMNRDDIQTLVNIIVDKFDDINNVFKNKTDENVGLLIVTNRASHWVQGDNYYGAHINY